MLHSKILNLRNSIDSSPIRKAKPVAQPTVDRIKRKDDDNPRLLKQYFCIWGQKDDYGTMPIRGCFSKSLQERGPNTQAPYKITALYMHSQADSVGLPVVLEEDEIGLYGEVPALEGVQVADELVIRHAAGVTNNGSYGFNYIWDKMDYDEANDAILMRECELFEVSFVTIGSQKGTFGVRSSDGTYTDETLIDETERLIRLVPRQYQLELRNLIDRHISLAHNQPLELRQKALEVIKPKQVGLDFDYLLKNFKK